jgi:steroid 5-alpha reductase family enzyme
MARELAVSSGAASPGSGSRAADRETGYPDVRDWPLWGRRNLTNALWVLVAPLPALAATWALFSWFPAGAIPPGPGLAGADSADAAAAWLLHHPIATLNALFFVNVCLGFWALALIQRSTWLIDPYWTLIPLWIASFYALHPLASPDPLRLGLSLAVLGIWSLRLTGNYFRRERWRFGLREDWRFARRRAASRHFWWFQFFYVYLAQQVMLVGLTLPCWAVSFHDVAVGPLDALLALLSLTGVAIAHLADTQLDAFMRDNEARSARGEPRVLLLDRGIWRWSRHPNYFGEQLFWWSFAGWGVVVGQSWVVIGTLLNSAVLAAVTVMTERRMLEVPERRDAYRAYQQRTSVWLPWPPRWRE